MVSILLKSIPDSKFSDLLRSRINVATEQCMYSDIFSYIPGNKLTSDDLGCVLEEVLDVSAQRYPLGLQLKVKTGTLDSIRTQFQNPRDQLLEMLKTWLNTSDNASWTTLTDALRSRSVGACQHSGVLETKYCLVEGTGDMYDSESQPETYITPPPSVSERQIPTPQLAVSHIQEGK